MPVPQRLVCLLVLHWAGPREALSHKPLAERQRPSWKWPIFSLSGRLAWGKVKILQMGLHPSSLREKHFVFLPKGFCSHPHFLPQSLLGFL
jgi:hypothetical protein